MSYPDKLIQCDLNKELLKVFRDYLKLHVSVSQKEYEEMGGYETATADAFCGFIINTLVVTMREVYPEKTKKKIFRRQIFEATMKLLNVKGREYVIEGIPNG